MDREREVARLAERSQEAAQDRQIDQHDDEPGPGGDPAVDAASHAQRRPRMRSRSRWRRARSVSPPMTSISKHGECGTQGPVLRVGEGDLDVVGDDDDRLAAQDLGLGHGSGGEHEGEQEADQDARHGERQLDLAPDLQPRGAEIARGVDQVARHQRQAEGHREQHERQVDVDHAEHDHAGREQDLRPADAEHTLECAVEHAALDEEQDPAIEADVLGDEQREHEQQADQAGPAAEHPR